MQELIFLYGPPAAGKTTYAINYCARYPDFERVSADAIRMELYGSQDIYGDGAVIYQHLLSRIREAFTNGKSVLYDATNLRRNDRCDFLRDLSDLPCKKTIVMLHVDQETARIRHEQRGRNIPWSKLEPYFYINEPPTFEEGWDGIMEVL